MIFYNKSLDVSCTTDEETHPHLADTNFVEECVINEVILFIYNLCNSHITSIIIFEQNLT